MTMRKNRRARPLSDMPAEGLPTAAQAMAMGTMIGRLMGIGAKSKVPVEKAPRELTIHDAQRLDAAAARRLRQNAKRLKNGAAS